jgi:hypothetical protein
MDVPKTLADCKKDIQFLMKYSVPEDQIEMAESVLKRYEADIIALNLLHSFYVRLPEGMDDSVKVLRLLTSRQGVFLLCFFNDTATTEIYTL